MQLEISTGARGWDAPSVHGTSRRKIACLGSISSAIRCFAPHGSTPYRSSFFPGVHDAPSIGGAASGVGPATGTGLRGDCAGGGSLVIGCGPSATE